VVQALRAVRGGNQAADSVEHDQPGQLMWCGVVWCGVVWCGVVWCGVVWCGVVWCGACSCSKMLTVVVQSIL
jgi:hypothetical protein